MQLTLGQLVAAAPSIEKIASQDTPPIQTRLRIKNLLKAAQSELAVHEELRVALVRKYGTEQQDGSTVTFSVTPENLAVFGEGAVSGLYLVQSPGSQHQEPPSLLPVR